MLINFNFPDRLSDLILSCVTSMSTSLLFNGGGLEPFKPSKGIKQGNPISPYLFILCMEYLGFLIEEKCQGKLWHLVKASRSGPSFSHLFFTDDLILFTRANPDSCATVKDAFTKFYTKSGQPLVMRNLGFSSLPILILTKEIGSQVYWASSRLLAWENT